MKIQCINCSTVFFIDDSLISGKGVKAQCPRCGHQTVVRADASVAPASSMGQNLGYSPAGPGPSHPPPGPPSGPGDSFFGDQSGQLGNLGTNDHLLGGNVPEVADPLSSYTSMAASPQLDSSPLLPNSFEEMYSPRATESMAESMAESTAIGPPPSFSEPLLSQQDLDLEPLIVHQDDGATRLTPHPSLPYAGSADQKDLDRLDPNWIKIRRISTGKEIGPVSLKEVRSLYVHGKISLDDEYAGEDLEWSPIREVSALLDILQRTPQVGQRKIPGPVMLTTSNSSGRQPWIFVLFLFLLLGGGGGAYYYLNLKPKVGSVKKRVVPVVNVNHIFQELRKKWRDLHPDVKPDAKKSKALTQKGMALLIKDRPRSYKKAASLFQQALLANKSNHRALAGLAVANAWKPRSRAQSSAQIAHRATQFEVLMRRKSQLNSSPLLEAAYALYLKADPDKALAKAKNAARRSPKEALVQLIAGELWLFQQQDNKKAQVFLKKALALNKRLARSRVLMAQIYLKQSRYYEASKMLRPLLRRRHTQAMYHQARLLINQGQYSKARRMLQRLLKRSPYSFRARMLLSVMLYQQMKQKNLARRNLSRFKKSDKLSQIMRLKVLLHRAYIDLLTGRLKRSTRRVQSIYQINKSYLPGKFLEAQVLFARKKYEEAQRRLEQVAARLPNEPKVQLLKAILLRRLGKTKEAISSFLQIAQQNTRFVWPRLFLGNMYLEQKNTTNALLHLKLALKAEPDLLHNQSNPSSYYLIPQLFARMIKRFQSTRQAPRSIYVAAAGVSHYQLNNRRKAFRQLRRSLALDRKGLAANLYMAQYLYDINSLSKSYRHAARAYQVYEQHPIAAQILGLIALKKRKCKKAEVYLKLVRRERPWFITGQVGMALTLRCLRQPESAMDEIKPLLSSYNYHHFLARALQILKH